MERIVGVVVVGAYVVDEGPSMKHKIQSVQHFGAEHLGDSSYYGAVL